MLLTFNFQVDQTLEAVARRKKKKSLIKNCQKKNKNMTHFGGQRFVYTKVCFVFKRTILGFYVHAEQFSSEDSYPGNHLSGPRTAQRFRSVGTDAE